MAEPYSDPDDDRPYGERNLDRECEGLIRGIIYLTPLVIASKGARFDC